MANRLKAILAAGEVEQQEVASSSDDTGTAMAGNGISTGGNLSRSGGGENGTESGDVAKVDIIDDGIADFGETHRDEELFVEGSEGREKNSSQRQLATDEV